MRLRVPETKASGPLDDKGKSEDWIKTFDWSTTALGPQDQWSASLTAIYDMMTASPFAMCVGWGAELTLLYNNAYTEFLADRHPAALGQPISEVWHDIWSDIQPLIVKAMAGEEVRFTDLHLTMTRKGFLEDTYWTFAYSPLRDGAVTAGFLNIATETTNGVLAGQRRDAAEAALRDANTTLEERIVTLAAERDRFWQLSRDPFVICDLEGRWVDASPVWSEILGWTREELIGRTSGWMEHPDDYDQSQRKVIDVASGEVIKPFVNRFRDRNGTYRTFSWTAVSEGDRLFCAARDVTDEMARSEALRLYGNIIQSDRSPVCAFDTAYRLIAFNQAHSDEFFRIYGVRVQLGDVFPDLFLPDQSAVMRGLMTRALTGEVFTVTEDFGDPKLVTPRWEISYNPLRGEDNRIVGAFHHANDVTERLRAQAELEMTQEALRQSQKMEAVGQLTGGLAHDFNNLLAVITGSLDLLGRRITQGRITEIDRFVTTAQTATKRATALTHRLLAFSRRQTLDPKPTGVNQLVASMDDMIRRTVGPEITVETVGAAGLWTTLVDPNQLENALLNLCINARDAMPDGGRLTIETANRWLDDRTAKARDLPPGQYVSLCVSDTGCGMSADIIAKAFDPFFTTKPLGQGTGLGLSMIYGFARQSGGQVRIYSEEGQGAMLCIYLPRFHGDQDAPDDSGFAEPEPSDRGDTVLVVDDEPGVRMLIGEVLRDLNYHVLEAEDGPSALKVVSSKKRIDLLVTDVGLPGGLNGRQVADAARTLRPGLKVLFITGYAENAVLGNGHLDHGMAVITKPFAIDNLANRIKDLIAASAGVVKT